MTINELIKEFIITNIVSNNNTNISDKDSLIDSGIIDSLGILKLLGFLEEKFSIELQGDELVPESFDSVESISNLIKNKIITT
ncbi:MAG: acyl carrier protein [bacterium]|jgi:acyl carrier protein